MSIRRPLVRRVDRSRVRSERPGHPPPEGGRTMRFMVMVKASKDSEAGKLPGKEMLAAMSKFNDELGKAGVLLAAEGLQPTSKGARVKFSGGKRTVTDG